MEGVKQSWVKKIEQTPFQNILVNLVLGMTVGQCYEVKHFCTTENNSLATQNIAKEKSISRVKVVDRQVNE